jgi:hypothetical protein
MISLDFSVVAVWPTTTPTLTANALTICNGGLARVAQTCLAIDGDQLLLGQRRDEATDPGAKRLFELFRIEQSERPHEGVGRSHTVVQPQEIPQPWQLGAPPLSDLLKVVRTAEHHTPLR